MVFFRAWGGTEQIAGSTSILVNRGRERCLRIQRQTHILARNSMNNVVRRRPQQLRNDRELINMILPRKQWLPLQHLGKDAARAPDIDLDVVLLPRQHDLGRAVVARRDVARHLRVLDAREPEVADLEVAVLVDEDVGGLEVAVHDAGAVDVFEAAKDLIEEVLDELLFEGAGGEEAVEVGAEELGDEVAGAVLGGRFYVVCGRGRGVHVFEGGNEDVAEGDDLVVVRALYFVARVRGGISHSHA